MRKWMVAILSVILIMVTTIGYIALADVFAVDEETPAEETATEEAAAEETATEPAAEEAPAEEAPAEEQPAEDAAEEAVPEVALPKTSASSYMVMSGSTSEKVAEKHADRKMQPGKITMLMTAMVAIDNMYDERELSNTVETGEEIATYGETFREGESASVGDLLKAMLVGGDTQAAELLAKYSASSRDIFVNEMNSKCMALGLMDTQFTNASGRYDITQYSTASDLAVIVQAAFRYQQIKDTLGLTEATISASSKEGVREIGFVSTDPLLTGDAETAYEYITGGIMGSMGDPVNGTQFAAVSVKDDMQLVVVLMDSEADKAASEARALLEYGDSKVTKNTIVKADKLEGHARVKGGAVTRVAAYTETKGFAYVPPEGSDALIQTQVVMFDDIEAPLSAGDKVGEFRIYVADELKGTVDLVVKRDVPVGWFLSKYYISNAWTIVIGVLLVLLIAFGLRVLHVKRRREKRREAMRRQKIREIARKQIEMDENRRLRNWNYGDDYYDMPPRTTDIRREAIAEEADKDGLNFRFRRKK